MCKVTRLSLARIFLACLGSSLGVAPPFSCGHLLPSYTLHSTPFSGLHCHDVLPICADEWDGRQSPAQLHLCPRLMQPELQVCAVPGRPPAAPCTAHSRCGKVMSVACCLAGAHQSPET